MSLTALTHVWKYSEQRHSTLLLLLAMADFADDYGRCWASVNTLARKARISERRVVDLVAILERAGEIAVDKGAGPRGVNVYLIVGGAEIAPASPGGGVQFRSAKLHPNLNEPSSSSTNEEERTMVNSGLGAIPRFKLVVQAWEGTVGMISGTIAEALGEMVDDAEAHRIGLPKAAMGSDIDGNSWVAEAIREAGYASNRGAPSLNFIRSLLTRWKAQGFKSAKTVGGDGGRQSTSAMAIDRWLEQRGIDNLGGKRGD